MALQLIVSNPAPAPVEHLDREYLDFLEMRDGHHNAHVRVFRDHPRLARIEARKRAIARDMTPSRGFRL